MGVTMSVIQAMGGWKGYAATALLAAVAAGAFAWRIQAGRADRAQARMAVQLALAESRYAQEREAQTQAVLSAVEAARQESGRRLAAMEKEREHARKQAAAAAADAAGLRADLERMRARADALVAAASGPDSSLAGTGAPRDASADMLAYLLGRVVDRAAALAGIADRARIAGLSCERSYEALRPEQAP